MERRTSDIYIADSLWALSHGKMTDMRLSDILPDYRQHNEREKTHEEIVTDFRSGFRKLEGRK